MKLQIPRFTSLLVFMCFGLGLFPAANASITYTLNLNNVDTSIANQISRSMSEAVNIYNANGNFNKHINVYYSAGVPTAQANYDGVLTFGGMRNTRVALHEISHTLGVGTHSAYWSLMTGGQWHGPEANRMVAEYDGGGSTLRGDGQHMWPYGLNYDSEDSQTNRVRHVKIVQALRCDMAIGPCSDGGQGTTVIEGVNRVITNRASGKVLDAYGNRNDANLIIYSDYGTANQRWQITHHGNGEYSIVSMQQGGRAMDTWNWGTENGTNIALYQNWGGASQRYYIEEVEPGWYRITPVIATDQCVDAYGTSNASNVGTWTWWGGRNQQWSIR